MFFSKLGSELQAGDQFKVNGGPWIKVLSDASAPVNGRFLLAWQEISTGAKDFGEVEANAKYQIYKP